MLLVVLGELALLPKASCVPTCTCNGITTEQGHHTDLWWVGWSEVRWKLGRIHGKDGEIRQSCIQMGNQHGAIPRCKQEGWGGSRNAPMVLVPSHTHLRSHGPRRKHVPAVAEPLWLHLGVTGPIVVGEAVKLGSALEDFYVMDQGLVAHRDHWLILQSSTQGECIKSICWISFPAAAACAGSTRSPRQGCCCPLLNGDNFSCMMGREGCAGHELSMAKSS